MQDKIMHVQWTAHPFYKLCYNYICTVCLKNNSVCEQYVFLQQEVIYDHWPVSFKLTVTVTEMANNWNILNQFTVTVTEIRLVTEM